MLDIQGIYIYITGWWFGTNPKLTISHGLLGFINHSYWINQFYKPNTGWWFGTAIL